MKDNTESPVVFDIAAALAELAALTDDIERLDSRLDHFEKAIEARQGKDIISYERN
jgi:hypothetical protein